MKPTEEELIKHLDVLAKYWREEKRKATADRNNERFQYCDGQYWATYGIRAYVLDVRNGEDVFEMIKV